MKVCPACKHTQESGKFCGKCGTPVADAPTVTEEVVNSAPQAQEETVVQQETAATQEPVTQTVHTAPNEQLEKVKEKSKQYFNYFLGQLKTPSVEKTADLKNHFISLGLFILITAISVYALLSSSLGGYASYAGISFFQVFFYSIIFLVLLILINVLAVFVTALLFSSGRSFKDVIGDMGSYFAVPIVISLLAILLALLKSMTMAMLVISLGMSIAFALIPIYIVSKLLHKSAKTVDSFYAFLVYFVISSVLYVLTLMFLADSALGQLLQNLEYIL